MENQQHCTSPDGSRNTPERCSSPFYYGDFKQEFDKIPEDDQGEGLIVVKVENEEDLYLTDNDPFKEEKIPPEISTDHDYFRMNTEVDEEAYVKVKEEEVPIEISTESEDSRATLKNVKIEEKKERHEGIKEEILIGNRTGEISAFLLT
uniref:Uncharacterized protein n=1 Tax=Pyxicephalus adspersus TaxID=30357 RepID=A0AAV2ZUL4_PYXAD|nr:TPA: hypothetical protein GDO54_004784 [Pyxicephalus adspersus]